MADVHFRRCVSSRDLHKSRSWWRRLFSKTHTCSDFKPKEVVPGKWFEVEDDQCMEAMGSFEGYWSYTKQDNVGGWPFGKKYAWSLDRREDESATLDALL